MTSPRLQKSLRTAAAFETIKGILVLLVGSGLLRLLHKDAHRIAYEFVVRVHLHPTQKYPAIFIDLASHLTDQKLWLFAVLALIYAAFRFLEGYGLWKERMWAEWLAVVSGTVYLPFELYEIWVRVSPVRIVAIVTNLAVVAIVGSNMLLQRKQPQARPPQ